MWHTGQTQASPNCQCPDRLCLNPLAPCPPNLGPSANAYLPLRFYHKMEVHAAKAIHLIPEARGYRHKSFRLCPTEAGSGWILTLTRHMHTQFLWLSLGREHTPQVACTGLAHVHRTCGITSEPTGCQHPAAMPQDPSTGAPCPTDLSVPEYFHQRYQGLCRVHTAREGKLSLALLSPEELRCSIHLKENRAMGPMLMP